MAVSKRVLTADRRSDADLGAFERRIRQGFGQILTHG